MKCEVGVADASQFLKMEVEWNELVNVMKRPSIFSTWDWIYTWWEHFGSRYIPLILLIRSHGALVGILPLALRTMLAEDAVIPARVISYCGSMELYPDHLDIISREEHSLDCVSAAFDFLAGEYKNWDSAHLSHLAEDAALTKWAHTLRRNSVIEKASVAPYIQLHDGYEEYMKRFSGPHRHNMNRLKNRLHKIHGVEFVMLPGAAMAEVDHYMGQLFKLHQARKIDTGIESTFSGDAIERFNRHVAVRFAKKGWLRVGVLRKRDTAIAIGYGFAYRNCFSYYQSGFDPEWERQSVGTTLLLETIEHGYKEGWQELDFLRGNEGYKYHWTGSERTLYTANIFNKTVCGKLAGITFRTRKATKALLQSHLQRSNGLS